jgi:outer membrane receptor for ferric coprogen and ferric-rhodotorulic acid
MNMKLRPYLSLLLTLLVLPPASAQVAPAVPAPTSATTAVQGAKEDAIVLSPFTVSSDEDKGYAASSALAGTRTNEKLANLPNSISVFTAEFLSDLALNDFFGAVDFAIGAENIYNDQGTIGAPQNVRAGNQISFRGINSIRQLRDGFPWFLSADNYNTERIEISRGPGGLAYGDVDPAGVINISTKRATFRNRAAATVRMDSFGTQRYSVDVNRKLAPRLGLRFNAINSETEQNRQRGGVDFRGFAGALSWEPFRNGKSRVDLNFERGTSRNHMAALGLTDLSVAYVRGSATNEPDGNPNLAGVQLNGIGMRSILQAANNPRVFFKIDGTFYDMQPTATTTFRTSYLPTTITAADLGNNPLNFHRLPAPHSIIPYGTDWSGSDNRHDTNFHAYNLELTHRVGDNLRILIGHNAQVGATTRLQTQSTAGAVGADSRSLFIDVNRVLPHPTIPNATIPNPRFEQYFILHSPTFATDGNKSTSWRTSLVHDTKLPFWHSTLRTVAGGLYRDEKNYNDFFGFAMDQKEIARRGITGTAATYPRNLIHPVHYISGGNADATLSLPVDPGVTTFYRQGTGQTRFNNTIGSANLTSLGAFFSGRLRTTAGFSRDYFRQNRSRAPVTFAATGETRLVDLNNQPILDATGYNVPYERFNRAYTTNQSYGGVFRLLPWLSLSGGYFESALYTDSASFELTGRPRLPRTGEGIESSLRFNFLNDRLNATLTHFNTTAENNAVALSGPAVNELNALLPVGGRLLSGADYRDQATEGWEFEMQTNLSRQWTLLATYSVNYVKFGRLFPLVRPYLAAARAAATAAGLDPGAATSITELELETAEDNITTVRRETAALTTRYSFTEGKFKGLAVGTAFRYALGKIRNQVVVNGIIVLPKIRTKSYVLMNPFISYRKRLFNHNFTAQLNVNNLLGEDSEQGNNYTWQRPVEPRSYVTTVTMEW